eukprot:Blabericola_migrator_1__12893@NODE_843_length_6287_cov_71_362219_g595_i0_p4_GENE_NODE_843_length_6287_cov_71_362219_g595_i0NODE_843_length_6287_cov_71_362219_g595_i0_p4_ORF_typecomplete_len136_score24_00BH3/PF15285_6/5e03BH3/PF15285_6/2_1BH3/PF15285_6/7_1e02_NODE_843_length_6287_cov_71_362219_g595_i057726179
MSGCLLELSERNKVSRLCLGLADHLRTLILPKSQVFFFRRTRQLCVPGLSRYRLTGLIFIQQHTKLLHLHLRPAPITWRRARVILFFQMGSELHQVNKLLQVTNDLFIPLKMKCQAFFVPMRLKHLAQVSGDVLF